MTRVDRATAVAISILQGCSWNLISPVAPHIKSRFRCGDGTVTLCSYCGGPIGYLLSLRTTAHHLDAEETRARAAVSAASLLASSAILRAIADESSNLEMLIAAQLLTGLVAPYAFIAGALGQQKVAGVAFIGATAPLGAALSFVVGPLIVRSEDDLTPLFLVVSAAALLVLLLAIRAARTPPGSGAFRRAEHATWRAVQPHYQALLARNADLDRVTLAFTLVYGYYSFWGSLLWPSLGNTLAPAASKSAVWYAQAGERSGQVAYEGTLIGFVGGLLLALATDALARGGRRGERASERAAAAPSSLPAVASLRRVLLAALGIVAVPGTLFLALAVLEEPTANAPAGLLALAAALNSSGRAAPAGSHSWSAATSSAAASLTSHLGGHLGGRPVSQLALRASAACSALFINGATPLFLAAAVRRSPFERSASVTGSSIDSIVRSNRAWTGARGAEYAGESARTARWPHECRGARLPACKLPALGGHAPRHTMAQHALPRGACRARRRDRSHWHPVGVGRHP